MSKLFAATLFLSAVLMFWLQPMIGRFLLPRYGGTPVVWNTCLVFSQAVLLLGYLYAHASAVWLSPRIGRLVHVVVLLAPAVVLPVGIADDWLPPSEGNPIPTLLAQLAVAAGLPMFVVATTAPLLQRWFADAGGSQPYMLYAASNVGSFSGLLAYPFVVEPMWDLSRQSVGWTGGYAVFAVLTVACAITTGKRRGAVAEAHVAPTPRVPYERLRWLVLSAVPSSLLVGVTTSVTTDIAAVPLLWVVPLGLYLITFVLVFGERAGQLRAAARVAAPALAALQLVLLSLDAATGLGSIVVRFGILFVVALGLHEELARLRPTTSRLTAFYLWVSVGGVCGGLFNTLLAPLVFPGIWEYPIALAAAGFIGLPGAGFGWNRHGLLRAGGMAAVALLATAAMQMANPAGRGAVLYRERNAFGVLAVSATPTGEFHVLMHGNTIHGAQYRGPKKNAWATPRTYYHPSGPIGEIFEMRYGDTRPVGVVGLGTGALASYGMPGQSFTFFEIDPAMARVAANADWFSYLGRSQAECRVVLGDARQSLAREPDGRFGVLVIDAFGGDGVPVHLLTREAMQLYRRKLTPDGILAFNVSNRYLDLAGVLGDHCCPDFVGFTRADTVLTEDDEKRLGKSASVWVVFVRAATDLRRLPGFAEWRQLQPRPHARPWTDQYCDLLGAIRW